MAGSCFGTVFTVTTWGESHGPALGAVVDGCPAGIPLSAEALMPYMARRRPDGGSMSTKRREADEVEILSGVFQGKTTGTPISLLIRNGDQHSSDYAALAGLYRPGHADFGFDSKYGFRDYRGGGRSSGRETAARTAAGAIAAIALGELGISFETRVTSIGGIPFEERERVEELLAALRADGDSIGSEAECIIHGVPAGIGDPVFGKLDARLAEALFSIGAVKAVEIGDGHLVSTRRGSENNDAFRMGLTDGPAFTEGAAPSGREVRQAVTKRTNHAGGILGGISDGSDIRLHVYFKPTPSISMLQETVTAEGQDTTVSIHGRHDPVIAPRAAVVVEAMAAMTLFDSMLIGMTARMDRIRDFYRGKAAP